MQPTGDRMVSTLPTESQRYRENGLLTSTNTNNTQILNDTVAYEGTFVVVHNTFETRGLRIFVGFVVYEGMIEYLRSHYSIPS